MGRDIGGYAAESLLRQDVRQTVESQPRVARARLIRDLHRTGDADRGVRGSQAETAPSKNNYANYAVLQTAATALLAEYHSTQGKDRRSLFEFIQQVINLMKSKGITYYNAPGSNQAPKTQANLPKILLAAYNAAGTGKKTKPLQRVK